jgi:hypothetical protein
MSQSSDLTDFRGIPPPLIARLIERLDSNDWKSQIDLKSVVDPELQHTVWQSYYEKHSSKNGGTKANKIQAMIGRRSETRVKSGQRKLEMHQRLLDKLEQRRAEKSPTS